MFNQHLNQDALNLKLTTDLVQHRPLRIAIFTAVYAPILSGVAIAVHQRVRWLLEQGHAVFLIHPQIDNQYPQVVQERPMPGLDELQSFSHFSSYAYPTKPLLFEKTVPEPQHYKYWSDTHLLENFQPDVVLVEDVAHMWGFCSLFFGGYRRPLGTQYARQTGIPVISLFHTDWATYSQIYIGTWFLKLLRPVIATILRQASRTYTLHFFPSKLMLEKYQALGVDRAEYFPFQGVDSQKFHPKNICYDPIPEERRRTLLFVGRIAPEKNVTQLLEAFEMITAQVPDVHLVFVGSGPQQEEIRQQAAKIGEQITVWGESWGEELTGWFARATLLLNPSVTENFCTTNMEALASGTPVVAASAGGNPEQIKPGINGFLAEPNNPKDFAQKAIAILKDSALQEAMSQQARSSIAELDWSVCMQKFEDNLYQLVKASNQHSLETIYKEKTRSDKKAQSRQSIASNLDRCIAASLKSLLT